MLICSLIFFVSFPDMPDNYNFYVVLLYISLFSILLPIIVGFDKRRNFLPEEKILYSLIILSCFIEIVIYILFKNHINNLFMSRIQGMVEFILLSLFFIQIFSSSKQTLLIKAFIFMFMGVAAFDLYLNGFNSLDNISLTTECILLMIYSLLAFFHLLQNPVHDKILSAPLFWFNTAILMYFSGNLFLFVFSNYLENHFAKVSPALCGIHSLLNIVFYLLISIGFWKTAAPKQI